MEKSKYILIGAYTTLVAIILVVGVIGYKATQKEEKNGNTASVGSQEKDLDKSANNKDSEFELSDKNQNGVSEQESENSGGQNQQDKADSVETDNTNSDVVSEKQQACLDQIASSGYFQGYSVVGEDGPVDLTGFELTNRSCTMYILFTKVGGTPEFPQYAIDLYTIDGEYIFEVTEQIVENESGSGFIIQSAGGWVTDNELNVFAEGAFGTSTAIYNVVTGESREIKLK